MLKLNSMRSTPPFLCIHYALLLILCPTKSCTLWSPEKIMFTDCDDDFLEQISPCTLHMLQISTFIIPHHPFLLGKLKIPQLQQLTSIGWDFHLMSFFLWQTEGKQKMKVTHAQPNQVLLPKLATHKWRWHIHQSRNLEHYTVSAPLLKWLHPRISRTPEHNWMLKSSLQRWSLTLWC